MSEDESDSNDEQEDEEVSSESESEPETPSVSEPEEESSTVSGLDAVLSLVTATLDSQFSAMVVRGAFISLSIGAPET